MNVKTDGLFANPFLQNKPSLDQEEEGIHRVEPGEEAPSEGPWHTLYFLPGIHDIGPNFQIHANKTYYIPGEFITDAAGFKLKLKVCRRFYCVWDHEQ